MHYCTANIKLAGEHHTVVARDTFNPVSWPEIEIIRGIHGNDSVIDVKPFVSVNVTPKEEKDRLRAIYGPLVEDVFPGRNPQMEMEAAGAKLPEQIPLWRNPVERDPVQADFNPPAEEKPVAEKPTQKTRTANPFAV